ncbi:MAG: BrnT family toxin [Selenomonadaceae bacterium]|nr:BrnT family toxin [Selenomonadaceae bacterium]
MGEIEIGDLIVEWDDNKAEMNWKKHRIHFEDAALIFLDENRIDEFDEEHSDYEERRKVIGMVENILFVVYTERGEKLRLISARNATRREKEDYYGQFYN